MPIARLLQEDEPFAVMQREPDPRFGDALAERAPGEPQGPYIEARSVARGFAALYERIRNTLDFRDEHLIRVFAIRRILKRRLASGARADKVTLPLLQELVRAGYVPQTAIPEAELPAYQELLNKYIHVFHEFVHGGLKDADHETWEWIFTLAANELESRLVPHPERQKVAQRFITALEEEGVLSRWGIPPEEKYRQLIVAVHRSLLKSPNELVTWQLFLHRFPQWTDNPSHDEVRDIALRLPTVRREFDGSLHLGAGERLARHIHPPATTLWLLMEALEAEGDRGAVLSAPGVLEERLRATVNDIKKKAGSKLRKTLWRSLLYIAATKMAIALLVEVPIDRVLQGTIEPFNIALTVLIPPLLLLIFGLSVRIPGDKNTASIVAWSEKLIYEGKVGLDPLRPPARYRSVLQGIFNFFYAVLYIVSFGAFVYVLNRLHFTVPGILIFLVFLSIVSFFGFRIREQAQGLIVQRGEEGFLVFVFAMFFLPILRTGRWISQQSSRINIFLYLFDVFIEVPLQAFLEFFDAFSGFVREKKDDVTI